MIRKQVGREKILTISVAAYNVEWCLEETLNSMLVDSVLPYLEVIIVNDGSSDKTFAIAEKFGKAYPDTFVVVDKENGGHGSTINASILRATGKYYKIVDGDDWVNQEDLPKFIELLKECEADIVSTKFMECYIKTGEERLIDKKYFGDEKVHLMEEVLPFRRFTMHEIAVKTELLKEYQVEIAEKCFYVDAEFMLYALTYAETVTESELCIYRYRLGEEGQSVTPRNRAKRIKDQKTVLKNMLVYYEKNFDNFSEEKREFVAKEIAAMLRYVLDSCCYQESRGILEINKEIRILLQETRAGLKKGCIKDSQIAAIQSEKKTFLGNILSFYLYLCLKGKGVGLALYIRWIRRKIGT